MTLDEQLRVLARLMADDVVKRMPLSVLTQTPLHPIVLVRSEALAREAAALACAAQLAELHAIVEEMHRYVVGAIAAHHAPNDERPSIPARIVGTWVTRFDDALGRPEPTR